MGYIEDRAGLAGRVALVAGGGGGLGRACAVDLGRAGMRLALCDRDRGLLDETAARLRSDGVEVLTSELDVRDADALASCFDTADAAFGGVLHTLVNVVGGTFRQPFESSTPGGWDALVRANFTWVLHAIQLAIPRMRAAGGGSIINLTSIEAHRAAPEFAVYGAMKAAVTHLGRTLALELAADGIRVNAIAPDMTPTEGTAALSGATGSSAPTDTAAADLVDSIAIPLGRKGDYGDVGGCALFLASDLAGYVTGQTVHCDGGALAAGGWLRWPDAEWRNTPPPPAVAPYLGAS